MGTESPKIADLKPKRNDLVMLVEQVGCSTEPNIGLYIFDKLDERNERAFFFSRAYFLDTLLIEDLPFPATVPNNTGLRYKSYDLQARVYIGKDQILAALKTDPLGQPYFAFIKKKLDPSS